MSDAGERFEIARPLDLQAAVLRCQRSVLLRGASDMERSVIATIVSELGSNVLKYAGRGALELRRVRRGTSIDVEVTASDAGPGIPDIELALTDHYSSGHTLGLGLPGVRRMADDLDIRPNPGGGTTVRATKRLRGAVSRSDATAGEDGAVAALPTVQPGPVVVRMAGSHWSAAAALRARSGQRSGGDAVAVGERDGVVGVAVVDATGHGPIAAGLARSLTDAFRHAVERPTEPLDAAALLRALHEASVGTVGAAAGVALLDTERDELQYLAVGNVRAAVVGQGRFHGVARDGVLGRRWPTPFVQRTALEPGDLVMLWTDGLSESLARDATRMAAAVGVDVTRAEAERLTELFVTHCSKAHDDAACLVVRWRP